MGDVIRDWAQRGFELTVFPYDGAFRPISNDTEDPILRYLWLARANLANSRMFGGKTKTQTGLQWYEYGRLTSDKLQSPLSITFAFVATHNHFVLDRGGKVFNRSAPVIKLSPDATENDHLGLLGLLNSSSACFWMKQVFHNKGGGGIGGGLATEEWEQFYEFDGTKLQRFPLPKDPPLNIAQVLDSFAIEWVQSLPAALAERGVPSAMSLNEARARARESRQRMIALQEEIDWRCYQLYGVTDDDLCMPAGEVPAIRIGERAFVIVLARRMAAGEVETKWFERHGSTPITEIPERWPAAYRTLVQRRIETIETNATVALIEQPEYKRRWNDEPWEEQQARALRGWLLDRLEALSLWSEPRLTTTAALADQMRDDEEFQRGGRAVRWAARLRCRGSGGRAGAGRERSAAPCAPLQAVRTPQARGLGVHLGFPASRGRYRRSGGVARIGLRVPHAGGGSSVEGGRDRPDPRPATLHVGRLPEGHLVAPAGQARRAQGTVLQPAVLRARRRSVVGNRLGGLERAGAEPGCCRVFQPDARTGWLDGGAAGAPLRRAAGTTAVGTPVSQCARVRNSISEWATTSRGSSTRKREHSRSRANPYATGSRPGTRAGAAAGERPRHDADSRLD